MKTAVLLIGFNRPDTTEKVLNAIAAARPPRLYFAVDGPRSPEESNLVQDVQHLARLVDWPCEVKTLFREKNLGCKRAVGEAITWFFENEEMGIVLEDDCLPHPDFFRFCEELLERYKDEPRVWMISGNNFQRGIKRGDASYFFSKYNHIWGWASWRRAWLKYDPEISFLDKWLPPNSAPIGFLDRKEASYWRERFLECRDGVVSSWAYAWTACIWYHGGLSVYPNVNLVSNIGFDERARTAKIQSPQTGSHSENSLKYTGCHDHGGA
ncbi:MAG: glycosyltransferase family 2 protein [Bdellovibrionaceae bacterium]|nr:glycosyltransferase family 2 protein [Pseudobdellovibrionaceae bacterium]